MTLALSGAIIMIQFDWSKIRKDSGGTDKGVILAISALTYPTAMPSQRQLWDNPKFYKDYYGISFLLNPEELLSKKYELPNNVLVEYIALASYRSLADYYLTGNKALDIRVAPFIPKNNQLLTINNAVHFKYE